MYNTMFNVYEIYMYFARVFRKHSVKFREIDWNRKRVHCSRCGKVNILTILFDMRARKRATELEKEEAAENRRVAVVVIILVVVVVLVVVGKRRV